MNSSIHKPREGQSLNSKRCAASVMERGRWIHAYQCARKGTLEHDGHKWCKQHFPPNVKKKRADRQARWNRENKAKSRVWRMEDLRREIVDEIISYFDTIKDLLSPKLLKAIEEYKQLREEEK